MASDELQRIGARQGDSDYDIARRRLDAAKQAIAARYWPHLWSFFYSGALIARGLVMFARSGAIDADASERRDAARPGCRSSELL
jgi:hypothetical protein